MPHSGPTRAYCVARCGGAAGEEFVDDLPYGFVKESKSLRDVGTGRGPRPIGFSRTDRATSLSSS